MYSGHWFGGGFMWLLLIILIIAIIWIVKLNTGNGNNLTMAKKSALEILNKRYANGEINRDLYKKMKKDLNNYFTMRTK